MSRAKNPSFKILEKQLASTDPAKGAALVGYGAQSVKAALDARTVAADLASTDPGKGAELVGYGAGGVKEALDRLTEKAGQNAVIGHGEYPKNITILGDSISHGAFALNTFLHGWSRVFHRMIRAETGTRGYGFANMLSLGIGATATSEIHSVAFGGSWTQSPNSDLSKAGIALRSPGVGSTITITVPFFQNRFELHYLQQAGGGEFTITINGTLAATVNAAGADSHQTRGLMALADNGYGSVNIVIEHTGAGTVDIVGPGYLGPSVEPDINNFSTSGRRLANVPEAVIQSVMEESRVCVMALGHNDQGDAESDPGYLADIKQRIDWLISYANANSVAMVVPDFCWTQTNGNAMRQELRRLARETGGLYINLPDRFRSDGVAVTSDYLINTLNMWSDGSHPNQAGHKWVAESVAKAMGLGVSTKAQAINYHDFWMPFPIDAAKTIENSLPASVATVTSYKRNGPVLMVKAYLQQDSGGAFPVGQITGLTTGFNAKSEITMLQGVTGIGYVRNDTGEVTSVYSLSPSGVLDLNVLASFINDQIFSFNGTVDQVF